MTTIATTTPRARSLVVRAVIFFGAAVGLLAGVMALRMAWWIGSRPTSGLAELVSQGDLFLSSLSFVATLVLVATTIVYAYGNAQIVREARTANALHSQSLAAAERRAHVDEVRTHLSLLAAATADLVRHSAGYAHLRPLRSWVKVPDRNRSLWTSGDGVNRALGDANVAASRLRMLGHSILAALADDHIDVLSDFHHAVLNDPRRVATAADAVGQSSKRLEQHAAALAPPAEGCTR